MTIQRELQQQSKELALAARERITGLVRALTPDQLLIRPDPQAWSVAEVLEHLCITDETIEPSARRAIASARADAAAPLREWKPSLLGRLVGSSLTSTKKYKTPGRFQPGPTPRGGVLEAFRQFDANVLQMMEDASQLDWRAIKVKSPALPPFAPAYNLGDVFHIHALHTTRHAGQIERVIAKL
jgi:hypothetical protein